MKRLGNNGRLVGRLVLEEIMRKDTRRRANARRKRRYRLANLAFFDLMA
jgi:hypothetical protein